MRQDHSVLPTRADVGLGLPRGGRSALMGRASLARRVAPVSPSSHASEPAAACVPGPCRSRAHDRATSSESLPPLPRCGACPGPARLRRPGHHEHGVCLASRRVRGPLPRSADLLKRRRFCPYGRRGRGTAAPYPCHPKPVAAQAAASSGKSAVLAHAPADPLEPASRVSLRSIRANSRRAACSTSSCSNRLPSCAV